MSLSIHDIFFFNDTATTEIYSYVHTLSLHVALPICRLFTPLALTKTYSMAAAAGLSVTLIPVLMIMFIKGKIRPEEKNPINRWLIAARSEEHTSELQSLMRSSYAVFCLKKKT